MQKARYINPKIETELVDFKKEIEDKFGKSKLRSFVFPLKSALSPKHTKLPNPMRSTRYELSTDRKSDRGAALHGHGGQGSFLAY